MKPVVPHIEFCLTEKPKIPKKIGESLKGPQNQFWREDLFIQYYRNNNDNLLSDPILVKYLPGGTKVICSLVASGIK